MSALYVSNLFDTMITKDFEYILVGCGFFCAVIAERIANDLGKKVLIVEKRGHVGGNCYSETDKETGIEFHKYGTHIFHTSNRVVWEYISRFTSFNSYYHQVLTTYQDRVYQMPINLETINAFYQINLRPFEVESFLGKERQKEYYPNPQNFEQQAINTIGRPLYEAFIKGYTRKQWGREPQTLPASIFSRLPFRKNYSESYYFDRFQGIPTDGFARLFHNMLDSPNIAVWLNTDFFDIRDHFPLNIPIIYSGPIDRLFDYKYGDLEYRSLRFEHEIVPVDDFQGTAVMNYADLDIPFTRIHEPRHLHPERNYIKDKTLIIREYACEAGREKPYYPIGGEKNRQLYDQYLQELQHHPNLIVGGRLGDYRYYDMHHVIENALNLYYQKIKKSV